MQAHTRDGIVCILQSGEDSDPVPKCPLPEYDDDLLTMPVSQLRNPAMTDSEDQNVRDKVSLGTSLKPLYLDDSFNIFAIFLF